MKLLKDSLAYGGLAFAQKGIGFLLLPVYTQYLSPEDYGLINTVAATVGFLIMFYSLGSEASISRHYFGGKESLGEVPVVWGTLIIATILSCLGLTLFFAATHSWLLDRAVRDVPFWPYLALGLLMAACTPMKNLYLVSLQTRERAASYMKLEGSFILFRLGLLLFMLIILQWKALGALVAFAVAEVIFAAIALGLFSKDLRWKLEPKILRASLAYSLPFIPYWLAGWSTTYLGVLVLNFFSGKHEVGLYAMAANLALIQTFLVGGFHQAFFPSVLRGLDMDQEENLKSVREKSLLAAGIFSLIAIALSLFGREILMLMAKSSYWPAARIAPPLLLAAFWQGLYVFYSQVLSFHKGASRLMPLAAIAGAVVAIPLMLILVPKYSIMGAAVAGCLGVLGRLLSSIWLCRTFPRLWPGKAFVMISLITIVGCLSVYGIDLAGGFSWKNLAMKTMAFAISLSVVLLVVGREVSIKSWLAALRWKR